MNLVQQHPPMRDYSVDCVAGVASKWVDDIPNAHFYNVIQCSGYVQVQFQSYGTLQRTQGQTGTIQRGFKAFKITSPIDQTIIISCGDDRETNVPPVTTGPGGVIPVPLPVVGAAGVGAHPNNADIPAPVLVSMRTDNGDGTSFLDPLQSFDRQSLLVGHVDSADGFVWSLPMGRNVAKYSTVRFFPTVSDLANAFSIVDQFGSPLGWYQGNGVFVESGIVPAGYAGAIYVPVVAVMAIVLLSAGGNTWGLQANFSSVLFTPTKQ